MEKERNYSLKQLEPFCMGKGTERICYHDPENPQNIIKLSPLKTAKQTRRELDYFLFLQKQQVPFSHLPLYKGTVRVPGFLGFAQQAILEPDGSVSPSLTKYCEHMTADKKAQLEKLLAVLYAYLYQYNILPCDLTKWNILVQNTGKETRLVLIDGLGCTDLIPLAQYCKPFGRRKIARKWKRFLKKEVEPLLSSSK